MFERNHIGPAVAHWIAIWWPTWTRRPAERPQGASVPHARLRHWPAAAAGIETPLGCHSVRPTGITAYLSNGGPLETAAMANHASTRTTHLDDRGETVSLDDGKRIRIC